VGKLDVLTKLPKSDYKEIALEVNSDEFVKVIESRRSVRVYTEEKIPEDIVRKCLDLALLAPNSSNLQPWEFYWVRSAEKKKLLSEYCLGQLAATTAQELIVCVARTDRWKIRRDEMLKSFDESSERVPRGAYIYYKKIVLAAYTQGYFSTLGYLKKILFFLRGFSKITPREPTSYSDMRVWAHKSTALACENLMLSFRAFGYDSCPMEGMDSARIKKLLNLSRKAEICMVISAGKRSDKGVFGPRVRMGKDKFVFEV
jgi:nitroreductase